jgi:hypothetical protein
MKEIFAKKYLILLIVAILIIGGLSFFFLKKEKFDPLKVSIQDLEEMQKNPPKDYIKKLEAVVEKNKDPYARERAIFTLTNITIKKQETDKVIDFLKKIAMNEKEDNVRSAAYANIDLIRDYYPLEKQGSFDLSLSGDIKKNGKIKIVAKVSSKIDVKEARVGISSLHKNIKLEPYQPVHKFSLKANEPKEFEFNLLLKETGEYEIPFSFILSFDRIDYEEIVKEIFLKVGESSGEVISDTIIY